MSIPQASPLGDARALDGLKGQASRDPRAATRQAAVQFESQFMQMVLKSMRDATMKAEGESSAQENFTSMLDAQFASQFAGRPGGLAEMIEKQLGAQMKALPAGQVAAGSQAHGASAAAGFPPVPSTTAVFKAAGLNVDAPAPTVPVAASTVDRARARATPAQADFMQRLLPHAQAAERATGVPASFILGQAALESGWGRGEIRKADGSPSFNLFGIKASAGWKGAAADARTTEFEGGQALRRTERFRSYESYSEAFTDFARMLVNHPRYSQAVRSGGSAEGYAVAMQRAGYATDPQYASKLARTIRHTVALQQALA